MAGHAARAGQEQQGHHQQRGDEQPHDEPDRAAGEHGRRLLAELRLHAVDRLDREAPEHPAHHVADAGAEEDEQERRARAGGRRWPRRSGRRRWRSGRRRSGGRRRRPARGRRSAHAPSRSPSRAHPASESSIEGAMAPPPGSSAHGGPLLSSCWERRSGLRQAWRPSSRRGRRPRRRRSSPRPPPRSCRPRSASSEIRICRAFWIMRFSPADSPFSRSRIARFRSTSATSVRVARVELLQVVLEPPAPVGRR